MNKGGYKIVNFNGSALSGTPTSISGIYNQIVDDYDKAVLVSGVSLNGAFKDDTFASAQEKVAGDSSKYVEITAYGGVITVTEDDEVTFTVATTPEELAEEIGDLNDLDTTDKSSVIDAINEIYNRPVNIKYVNVPVMGNGTDNRTVSLNLTNKEKVVGVVSILATGSASGYTTLYEWALSPETNELSCRWTANVSSEVGATFKLVVIENN